MQSCLRVLCNHAVRSVRRGGRSNRSFASRGWMHDHQSKESDRSQRNMAARKSERVQERNRDTDLRCALASPRGPINSTIGIFNLMCLGEIDSTTMATVNHLNDAMHHRG